MLNNPKKCILFKTLNIYNKKQYWPLFSLNIQYSTSATIWSMIDRNRCSKACWTVFPKILRHHVAAEGKLCQSLLRAVIRAHRGHSDDRKHCLWKHALHPRAGGQSSASSLFVFSQTYKCSSPPWGETWSGSRNQLSNKKWGRLEGTDSKVPSVPWTWWVLVTDSSGGGPN